MRQLPTKIRQTLLEDIETCYNAYVQITQNSVPDAIRASRLLSMFTSLEEITKQAFTKHISEQDYFEAKEKQMLIHIFERALNGESPLSIARLSPMPDDIESDDPLADFMRRFTDALDRTFIENDCESKLLSLADTRSRSAPIPIPSPTNFG